MVQFKKMAKIMRDGQQAAISLSGKVRQLFMSGFLPCSDVHLHVRIYAQAHVQWPRCASLPGSISFLSHKCDSYSCTQYASVFLVCMCFFLISKSVYAVCLIRCFFVSKVSSPSFLRVRAPTHVLDIVYLVN